MLAIRSSSTEARCVNSSPRIAIPRLGLLGDRVLVVERFSDGSEAERHEWELGTAVPILCFSTLLIAWVVVIS